MKETQELRRYIGSQLAAEALRCAMRRRFAEALSAADRASRTDPSLPHPHVIASKSLFWLGDTDGAETRLQMARKLGFDASAAGAMQAEIDRFRELSRARSLVRERTTHRIGILRDGLVALGAAIAARFTREAIARLATMFTIVLTLVIAWWLRGARP